MAGTLCTNDDRDHDLDHNYNDSFSKDRYIVSFGGFLLKLETNIRASPSRSDTPYIHLDERIILQLFPLHLHDPARARG